MKENSRGIIEMTIAMCISGTIGLMVVLSGRPVTEVVFWRCLFGIFTLLPICFVMGYLKAGQATKRQLIFAALGGVAIVINWLCLFASYTYVSISIATTIYNIQPFMLIGLCAIFLRERVTWVQLGWLIVSFIGVLFILQGKADLQSGHTYLLGVLLSATAAFFYAVAAFITKQLKGMSPFLISLIQVIVGAILLFPTLFNSHEPITAMSWVYLITLGVVHTGLMYILLYSAIQKLATHLIGALSFIYPVVAFIIDTFVFKQRFQLLQIFGALCILFAAAAIMLGWGQKKRKS